MKNLSTLDTKLSTLILALSLTALCASCRTKKEIAAESRADIDSVAATVASAHNLRIDSAMRHINFDFDTLEITIERYAPDTATCAAALNETVRIRAVGGRLADRRKQIRNDIAGYNRLDTVAYRHASATSRAEHTATTSVAEPPDTTRIFLALGTLVIIVSGIFIYLRRRR